MDVARTHARTHVTQEIGCVVVVVGAAVKDALDLMRRRVPCNCTERRHTVRVGVGSPADRCGCPGNYGTTLAAENEALCPNESFTAAEAGEQMRLLHRMIVAGVTAACPAG